MQIDQGSFRDRHARLHVVDGRVVRVFSESGRRDWDAAVSSGLVEHLVAEGKLIAGTDAGSPDRYGLDGALAVESDLVEPITYPSEWSFEMLRDAARLTLDVTDAALAHDLELKDASGYNVVFDGCRPVFVDLGSFEAGYSGHWRGYAQFVDHFLAPLMLTAYRGVPFQPYLRGHLDGIPIAHAARFLSGRSRVRRGVLKHVVLRTMVEGRTRDYGAAERGRLRSGATLPVEVTRRLVANMRKLVDRLEDRGRSEWEHYIDDVPYSGEEHQTKRKVFGEMVEQAGGGALAWDIGANDGTFSDVLATHHDRVLALDIDERAVDRNYRERRATERGARIVPAVIDIADPPAGRGWAGGERLALVDRATPDTASWLAVVHHLSITGGVPLELVGRQIAGTSRRAIVEWVEPDDAQVELLLSGLPEGTRDYRKEALLAGFGAASVVREEQVSPTRSLMLVEAP